jgi:aryl-alcohol dehydrogenase-like predicted oxidoreductase
MAPPTAFLPPSHSSNNASTSIPRIGLGLMGMHFLYGPATPDSECFALLDRALELGETFWDTSDVYGGSEEMLGRYFKARPGAREKVFLATKFGVRIYPPEFGCFKSWRANVFCVW